MTQKLRFATGSVGLLAAMGAIVLMSSCRHSDVVAQTTPSGALMFPKVSGTNLLDEPITLPDDVRGQPTLVHVAFFRRQQDQVDSWLAHLDRLESEGIQVLECPTISSARWGWMAGFIDGGMRSGIEAEAARRRTVSLYTDTAKFRDALGLETNREIYSVMLDAEGRVLGIEAGEFSEQKFDRMLSTVE